MTGTEALRKLIARSLRFLGLLPLARRHQDRLERIYYRAIRALRPAASRTVEQPLSRVSPGAVSPLATFVLTSFQHRRFVGEALASALAQTYSPLEILVFDDGSTDGSVEYLREQLTCYRGPHRVQLRVNTTRQADLQLNAAMPSARGEYIVLGSSDDIAHPDRVARTIQAFQERSVSLVTANAVTIDAAGTRIGLFHEEARPVDYAIESLATNLHITPCFGAGLAFARQVWDMFGPLIPGPRQVDIVLPFRASLLHGVHFIREPLLDYRIHGGNASYRLQRQSREATAGDAGAEFWESGNRIANYSSLIETLDIHLARRSGQPELLDIRALLIASMIRELRAWSILRRSAAVSGIVPF